jgi:hypothetical protein
LRWVASEVERLPGAFTSTKKKGESAAEHDGGGIC